MPALTARLHNNRVVSGLLLGDCEFGARQLQMTGIKRWPAALLEYRLHQSFTVAVGKLNSGSKL